MTQDELLTVLKAKVVKLGGLGTYTRMNNTVIPALWVGQEPPTGYVTTGIEALIRPVSVDVMPYLGKRFSFTYCAEVVYVAHGVPFSRDFIERTAPEFIRDFMKVEVVFQPLTLQTLAEYKITVYA